MRGIVGEKYERIGTSFSFRELESTSEMSSLVTLCFLILMFALFSLDEAEAWAAWELKQKLHISCTDDSNVCKNHDYIELHPLYFIPISISVLWMPLLFPLVIDKKKMPNFSMTYSHSHWMYCTSFWGSCYYFFCLLKYKRPCFSILFPSGKNGFMFWQGIIGLQLASGAYA